MWVGGFGEEEGWKGGEGMELFKEGGRVVKGLDEKIWVECI